ncbi:MAG: hypothetical protein AAFX55_18525 [Bacteroidota bacterium]
MTTQTKPKGKNPTHTLYVKSYIDGNSVNVKAGVAWKHSKGDGFNISLNDMVVFENKPREEGSKNNFPQP